MKKRLLALLLAVCMAASLFAVTAGAEDPAVTLVSVQSMGGNQLLLTFSAPVNFNDQAPYIAIRLVDPNALGVQMDASQSEYLQVSGSLSAGADKTQYIWTAADAVPLSGTVSDMIGRTGVFAPYSALEARLCLEEGVSDATPVDGYFQGISSESGVKLSINEAYSTEFDDMYFPITSFEQSPLQLTAAAVINNTTMELTFNEAVTNANGAAPFSAVRYMTAEHELAVDGPENYLQFAGTLSQGSASNKLFFTLNDAAHNLDDILNFTGDQAKYADSGYTVEFCLQENLGNSRWGEVEGIANASGRGVRATVPWTFPGADSVYIAITQNEPDFTITNVTAVGVNQLKVVFSGPVEIIGTPYMGLRIVDDNNILQWTGDPDAEGSQPLQWGSEYVWEYTDDSHTSIVVALGGVNPFGEATINDIINRTGDAAIYAQYKTMFCIEEIWTDGVNAQRGRIDNIKTTNNVYLYANMPHPVGNDGIYAPVTAGGDEILYPEFSLKRAVAASDTVLILEFTKPVTVTEIEPYMALRIVDDNNELIWTGDPGTSTPVQFAGSWGYAKGDHSRIVWTLNTSNAFGVTDVADIINRTGPLAGYAQYKTMFCIEEIWTDTNTQPGLIDNIVDANGVGLHANKPHAIGYDGTYAKVVIDKNYLIPDTGDIPVVLCAIAGLAALGGAGAATIMKRKRHTA